MNPKLGIAVTCACVALLMAGGGCSKSSTGTTPTPAPVVTGSAAPDTLYVQDNGSKSVRVYRGASLLNGAATAIESLPTSDISNPDVIYSPVFDVLWYPSAYPNATLGPPVSTPIKLWTAASTKNNMNPDQQVPYSNGAGTATYDSVNDLLYVANVNGSTIQIYKNAHLLTGASLPSANITLIITDSGVSGTPRPQEMLLDPASGRLFVSDEGSVVAVFDNFAATALSAANSGTSISVPASREILGLSSPDGLAYSPSNDILFVGEISRRQIDVIHNASTFSGPQGHTQTITNFSTGPGGMAYDAVRDLLFIYDPIAINVLPNPETASGAFANIPNRRQFFDTLVPLSGFGIAVDTTH